MAIRTLDEFKTYVTKIFLGRDLLRDLAAVDNDWERCWKYYLRRLIIINRELIALVEKCTYEEKVLWVIGY